VNGGLLYPQLFDGLYRDGYGTVVGISGIATDVSAGDLTLCQLTFDVLDASHAKVSNAVAATNGLKAGQSWKFQAVFTTPFSVQFTSIAPGTVTAIAAVQIGHKFDATRLSQLHDGVSRFSDAVAIFGKPTTETNYSDGRHLAQWMYQEGSSLVHIAILFNAEVVMIRVTQRSGF
jgi:hypothetical protein